MLFRNMTKAIFQKNQESRTSGEVAQLRVQTALPGNPALVPSTQRRSQLSLTPVKGESDSLLWPLRALSIMHSQAGETAIYIKLNKI